MQYQIPEEWLTFSDFKRVSAEYRFYPYGQCWPNAKAIPLAEIEPPIRDYDIEPFKKFKMVPVLMAMMDPNGTLPPITVALAEPSSRYRYKVVNGFHRFYASLERGYPFIPIVINDDPDRPQPLI
ncbi:MAG: ParB N-terminal domain-containing protein [Rhodanobacter sp.]